MLAITSLVLLLGAMGETTALWFRAAALFIFLGIFLIAFLRVATRKEAAYEHDATLVLDEDIPVEPNKVAHHE